MTTRASVVLCALATVLTGTGCRTFLGIDDVPPVSECLFAADCDGGQVCVEGACVPNCADGGCGADAAAESAGETSVVVTDGDVEAAADVGTEADGIGEADVGTDATADV